MYSFETTLFCMISHGPCYYWSLIFGILSSVIRHSGLPLENYRRIAIKTYTVIGNYIFSIALFRIIALPFPSLSFIGWNMTPIDAIDFDVKALETLISSRVYLSKLTYQKFASSPGSDHQLRSGHTWKIL